MIGFGTDPWRLGLIQALGGDVRYIAISLLGLVGFPTISFASCIIEPIDKSIEDAATVFIATITSAEASPSVGDLHDGDRYKVKYGFVVARTIKGDPSLVSALTTGAVYDNPSDDRFTHYAEQSRLVPGDSILVVADTPGDVPVSAIGCTPSRPWDDDASQLVSKLPGFTP